MRDVARRVLLLLITLYQRIASPLKASPSCRFHPTCSAYAIEAIELHGALRGSWLALRRILKCHPFHPGGLDPVPERRPRRGVDDDAAIAAQRSEGRLTAHQCHRPLTAQHSECIAHHSERPRQAHDTEAS